MTPQANQLDDHGTTAGQAAQMLQKMLAAFDKDPAKVAIAMGRSQDEIEHALSGNADAFDDDFVMKMRGIAKERGIEIE
jgi:DNA-nicking Smr family endonuclease